MTEDPTLALDGRRQRSQRSRERLLDAVEAVIAADGVISPEQIATKAGVSLSTLFRHFGDMEGLAAEMRTRASTRVDPLLTGRDFVGDRATRVRELVRRRTAAFEAIAPLQRAALRQPLRTPGARAAQQRLETLLRDQLDAAIGRDFPVPHGDAARTLLRALLGFETWNHLRVTQQLDTETASRLLERGALALLAAALT